MNVGRCGGGGDGVQRYKAETTNICLGRAIIVKTERGLATEREQTTEGVGVGGDGVQKNKTETTKCMPW